MLNNCTFLNSLWLDLCGIAEKKQRMMPSLSVLREEEWDSEFEQAMRNRLIIGAFRYERLCEKKKGDYDFVENAILRLRLYQQDHKLEHLVDSANLSLLEFHVQRKEGVLLETIHEHLHHTEKNDGKLC